MLQKMSKITNLISQLEGLDAVSKEDKDRTQKSETYVFFGQHQHMCMIFTVCPLLSSSKLSPKKMLSFIQLPRLVTSLEEKLKLSQTSYDAFVEVRTCLGDTPRTAENLGYMSWKHVSPHGLVY